MTFVPGEARAALAIRLKHFSSAIATRPWFAPVIAVLLSWGYFAWSISSLLGGNAGQIHPVRQEMLASIMSDPSLQSDIAFYVCAQLFLHSLLAAVIVMLGRASLRAYGISLLLPGWVLVWAVVLLTTIYVLNAGSFPYSLFARLHPILSWRILQSVSVADAVAVVVAALILATVVRAALSLSIFRKQVGRLVAYACLVVCFLSAIPALRLITADQAVAGPQPHIIIIGIDSLRPDAVGKARSIGVTPNVDVFLREATLFDDATTPLARTFASWMAILSGRHPMRTGVRDNLIPKQLLDVSPTLADRLRTLGYATVYATDEVRFSNIDQSYGFDRVIGPKMGASDFIIASLGDIPLSNLVVNTRLGRLFFPNLYANRGAAKTYRLDTFTDWVDREMDFSRPTFMAVHLTLPHSPYYWAEDKDAIFGRSTEKPYSYLTGVVGADRQFGALMSSLEKHGALNNAIVMVLSDHGEALGMPVDNLLNSREAKQAAGRLLVSMRGHGASVLSPTQYQVVLAIRQFGDAVHKALPRTPRVIEEPVSLEDVAPTLLDFAGGKFDSRDFDGHSLIGAMTPGSLESEAASRIRFTETGLTTTFMRMGNFTDEDNLTEGMKFFAVDPTTHRVVFRKERFADLFAQKERAAFSQHWILAAIPDTHARKTKYVLVNRAGGIPEVVTYDPDSITSAEFVRLWQAMRSRFASDLEYMGVSASPAAAPPLATP